MTTTMQDLTDILKEHMGRQPYKVICADCNSELQIYKVEVDRDLGLTVYISACSCEKEN
jgi:hypothetical protein